MNRHLQKINKPLNKLQAMCMININTTEKHDTFTSENNMFFDNRSPFSNSSVVVTGKRGSCKLNHRNKSCVFNFFKRSVKGDTDTLSLRF